MNRTQWHALSYSPDGEWLAGGAADAAAHKIYIWDCSGDGQLVNALDGGTAPLLWLHVSGMCSCGWFGDREDGQGHEEGDGDGEGDESGDGRLEATTHVAVRAWGHRSTGGLRPSLDGRQLAFLVAYLCRY